MKRYLVFDYDIFYPGGGFNDLRTVAGTIEEIKAEVDKWKNEDFPSDLLDVIDTYSMDYVFRAEINSDYADIDNIKRTLEISVDKIGAY